MPAEYECSTASVASFLHFMFFTEFGTVGRIDLQSEKHTKLDLIYTMHTIRVNVVKYHSHNDYSNLVEGDCS